MPKHLRRRWYEIHKFMNLLWLLWTSLELFSDGKGNMLMIIIIMLWQTRSGRSLSNDHRMKKEACENLLNQFAILSQDYINAHCLLRAPGVTISLATGRGNGQFYLTIANKLDVLHTLIWRTWIRTCVVCNCAVGGGKSIKSYGNYLHGPDKTAQDISFVGTSGDNILIQLYDSSLCHQHYALIKCRFIYKQSDSSGWQCWAKLTWNRFDTHPSTQRDRDRQW